MSTISSGTCGGDSCLPSTVTNLITAYADGLSSINGRLCDLSLNASQRVDSLVGCSPSPPSSASDSAVPGNPLACATSVLADICRHIDSLESIVARI
ncbi:MAG: hypothetical protein JKY67_00330 [Pseudomonadales bacterium]|nr:hypothetical protein [Pseudomonadales bacterium]